MRVLNCDRQPEQPFPEEEIDYRKEEDALVESDVDYLIRCLNRERNTFYKIKQRPDIENRQSPQPDYLVEDSKTGNLLAIEHARFFEGQEVRRREANRVKELERQSSAGAALISSIRFPTTKQLGKRLSDFVIEKLDKGQFKNFSHAERILLARNKWSGLRLYHFTCAEPYFKLQETLHCDHFYLIVERKLLEVF